MLDFHAPYIREMTTSTWGCSHIRRFLFPENGVGGQGVVVFHFPFSSVLVPSLGVLEPGALEPWSLEPWSLEPWSLEPWSLETLTPAK